MLNVVDLAASVMLRFEERQSARVAPLQGAFAAPPLMRDLNGIYFDLSLQRELRIKNDI